MRPAHPLHNPFRNRFNEPVRCRTDEMQSDAYMTWLRDRDALNGSTLDSTRTRAIERASGSTKFVAGMLGLLALIGALAVFLTRL